MAPFTGLDFLTQEHQEWSRPDVISPSVVFETPSKASGRHHTTSPWSVQEVAPTAALPSYHSEDQIKRTENRCQSQLSHGSSLPQTKGLNGRSFQSECKANQAASEHSSALNEDPMDKLYAEVDDLSRKGWRFAVVHQALADRYLNQNDPSNSDLITAEHIVMVIGQGHADLQKHATAFSTDNVRGHQDEKQAPLQDGTGGEFRDQAGTCPKPANPNGGDLSKQLTACAVTDKESDWAMDSDWVVESDWAVESDWDVESDSDVDISKPANLKKLAINDESAFRSAFLAHNFRTIKVGASAINLLDLAKDAFDVNRNNGRYVSEKETWQLLFNIIANMLMFGLKPLSKIVEAISEPSASDTISTKSSHPRKVYQPSTTDNMLDIGEDEEALRRLTNSMCSWAAEDRSSPLIKVYSYHDKLKTVHQYDEMLKPGNEGRVKNLLQSKKLKLRYKERVSTAILRYICDELRKKHIRTTVRHLSTQISQFRTVCALVDAFGEGVLVLLGANPQKFLNRVERDDTYFRSKHERLRDVVMSLRKADRNKHDGKLRRLFVDLRRKVLEPALHFRKHKNTKDWLIDYPGELDLEIMRIGKRIPFILGRIERTSSRSNHVLAQARECSLKRRTSCSGTEEAAEGSQCTDKRTKLT